MAFQGPLKRTLTFCRFLRVENFIAALKSQTFQAFKYISGFVEYLSSRIMFDYAYGLKLILIFRSLLANFYCLLFTKYLKMHKRRENYII